MPPRPTIPPPTPAPPVPCLHPSDDYTLMIGDDDGFPVLGEEPKSVICGQCGKSWRCTDGGPGTPEARFQGLYNEFHKRAKILEPFGYSPTSARDMTRVSVLAALDYLGEVQGEVRNAKTVSH